jgi:hypothetical protein
VRLDHITSSGLTTRGSMPMERIHRERDGVEAETNRIGGA